MRVLQDSRDFLLNKMAISSANLVIVAVLGKLLVTLAMYGEKSSGLNAPPWGTPLNV